MSLLELGTPPFPQQVVTQAFYNIQKSGLFTDAREWRRLPQAEKTWEKFKEHFARAHHELKEATATARTSGYTGNSAMQRDPFQALNNLANATVADRETMANLTATINVLTMQLSQTNTKLNEALVSTASLQLEPKSLKNVKNGKEKSTFNKYCWTQGIKCGHSSAECNKQAEGHKVDATEENKMGGGGGPTKWQNFRR